MVVALAFLSILTQFGPSVALAASASTYPTDLPSPRPRIRPSEIRGKPMVKITPKPPRAHGIATKAKNQQALALTPKADPKKQGKHPSTRFELTKNGDGKLLLKYLADNPQFEFNTRAPFVIQLNVNEPMKLEPSVITRENWPKNGTQLMLSYQGASKTAENVVLGKAAFTVCEKRTKECRKTKVPIELHFR